MFHKILFCLLGVAGIGVPFNTPWHYGYGFLIAFCVVFGTKRSKIDVKWIFLSLSFFGASYFIPQLDILEKQRLLVEKNQTIPPQEFIKNISSYPFAQTADGFIQKLGRARLVQNIKLENNPRDLRSGYVNKPQYNFYNTDLVRDKLPFVVCYKITQSLINRGLKAQGVFYYGNKFVTYPNPITIHFKDELLGTNFYAFGADRRFPSTIENPYLSLKLIQTWSDSLRTILITFLKVLGISILAYGFFMFSLHEIDWRESVLLGVWTFMFLLEHNRIIGKEIFASAGSDGIVHGGYPYLMLEKFAANNWLKALESPESIFYFMPGMRYVRFTEMLIFGDNYPLQLTILLFTPIIYYRFFKCILTPKVAFFLSLLMFIKALNFIGLSYKLHLVRFLKLYGENISYAFLFGGLIILIKGVYSRWKGVFAFLLFAVAASIRPNLIIFISCLTILHFFLPVFSKASKKDKLIQLLGLSLLILIPVHNIIFGGQWVLLTSASQISENLPLPPYFYIEGFKSLMGMGEITSAMKNSFINHFMGYGALVIVFMVTNFLLFIRQKQWNTIKALTTATFFGLGMHLFYLANDRYLHPYLTISVVMLILLIKDYRSNAKIRF